MDRQLFLDNQMVEIEHDVDLEEAIKELIEPTLAIVVYNDDYNTFQHVIECFVAYCDHSPHQAEQCALIIHNNGKCAVKNGSKDKLQPIYEALLEKGLTCKIEK